MSGTKVQHKKDGGEALCLDSSGPSPSLSCDDSQPDQARRQQCMINETASCKVLRNIKAETVSSTIGTRLGIFEITAKLGFR